MKGRSLIIFFALLLGVFATCFGAAKTVYFDGTGDYITLGTNQTQAGMNGATGLTLETWVKPSSLRTGTSRNVIADFCLNGALSMVMMYFTDSGIFRFGGRSRVEDNFQSIQTPSAVVSTGNWYHMAGVLDFTNKTIKIYQNGELIGSVTGVSFGSNTYTSSGTGSTEVIGVNQPLTATQFYHGYMDDMRIWNTPRTQAQIQFDMTIPVSAQSNLLGYWNFDDSANDSSGNGYNGTFVGDTAYSSDLFEFGKYYRSIADGSWRSISKWEVSLNNSDWLNATVYPIAGVNTYIRTGDDITMGADARCLNLIMDGGTLTISTYTLNVTGTLTETAGTISGEPNILGYASSGYKRLAIAETGNVISGFSAATSIESNMPQKIDREWTIDGTFTGNKTVTFYWDATDDGSFNWGSLEPAVYDGVNEYAPTAYDVSSNPRWATVSLPSFAGSTYTIGRSDEDTLPVELSSFLVTVNAYNKVLVQWITQSETDVSGFRLYRGTSDFVDEAICLNVFIPATNTSQMQMYQFVDTELTEPGTYNYWLENLDLDGSSMMHGHVTVIFSNIVSEPPSIPIMHGLISSYPNPFNPSITIKYGVSEKTGVELGIYNLKGQKVRNLIQETKDQGTYSIVWDGKDSNLNRLPSGIYLIRMISNGQTTQRKVVMTK
ncbi:MAG: LamG-like jellyroll fold domain-containing protein [Candidatus Cloacimonas sp.]|jgi:hypothetical protein|nr:LamG-like jellyroll fold domain-containing protein [Candidatus Cloacimonas sp.]